MNVRGAMSMGQEWGRRARQDQDQCYEEPYNHSDYEVHD
jgi:hypothetical protein